MKKAVIRLFAVVLAAVIALGTTCAAADSGTWDCPGCGQKIGYVMGQLFGGIRTEHYAEVPDPEHLPLSCDLVFEQSLGLEGEARMAEDGTLVLNGYLNVRGVAQPIMTAIDFETDIFPDQDAVRSQKGTVPSSSDLYIRRSDGETFVDAVIDAGPQMCRLYITGSEEEGWQINGYPKDELVGFEGYPER